MKKFYTFDQKIVYNQAKEDLNKGLKIKYHELKLRLRDENYADKEEFNYINGQMDLIKELVG